MVLCAFCFSWANDRKMPLALQIDRRKCLPKIPCEGFPWLLENCWEGSVLGQGLCWKQTEVWGEMQSVCTPLPESARGVGKEGIR